MRNTAERNFYVALEWQKAGAHVFVAKPENKRPFLRGWRDKSTIDPDIVKEWFKRWPNALPAIDLAKSGHVVIDGDRHHAGPDGVCHAEKLFAEHGLIASAIPTVATPQNGRHYWFTQPNEGEPIGNSDKPVRAKGINVRGAGGYVIAPGALLPNGKEYSHDPNTPSTIEAVRNGTVPVLPPSIVALLRPNGHAPPPPAKPAHSGAREEAYAQAALANVASEITKTSSGSRNIELNNGALRMGHMVASGWIGRATVVGRLFDAAAACGLVNDDGAHSVRATIKSGLNAGEKEPQAPLSDQDEAKLNGHDQKASEKPPGETLAQMFTAEALRTMTFDPIRHVVPGFIVEGLTLFAGKPKIGKSWLLMHAAWAVADGNYTLGGIACEAGDVLYAALEDNKRRLQRRMTKLFGMAPWPKRLTFVNEMPRLAQGGLKFIRAWIESVDRPRLIIIDTLAMVRMPNRKDQNSYDADYTAVKDLRDLAAEYGVAIVLVHHLRKAEADDPFDTISGTLGLTGAPDTIMIIFREGNRVLIQARGRDVEDIKKAVEFDPNTCIWSIVGDADTVRQSAERTAVVKAMEEAGEPIGPRQVAEATGMKIANTRMLMSRMKKDGAVKAAGKFGKYELANRGPELAQA